MTTDDILRLSNLKTGYTYHKGMEVVVSRDIDCSLTSGSLTCLLGPNGAGKSTLLRTICGFQPPLGGEVSVSGRPLETYTPAELSRSIGVVLTERVDADNMTAEELVAMGRSPYTGFWGRLGDDDHRIVERAMKMTSLESLRRRSVHTLSDGERQKVMIAKALAQQTPIIVLDEPTAFLDYPSKVEIMHLLLSLAHTEGKSILMSTHDMELALQTADYVWLMDKRLGLRRGIPEDLSYDGSLEQYFCREGIRFDHSHGQFRIVTPAVRRIHINGMAGVRRTLLRKALQRRGIASETDAPQPHECAATPPQSAVTINGSITVSPDGYIWRDNLYTTLEALLTALQ